MITYQNKKVTPKVYAKHQVSDHLMKLFDNAEFHMDKNFVNFTDKEQQEILKQVSIFEDRVHKLLGVRFSEINSTTNFEKVI
tara:strand:+ start:3686 stop:3931 length:246 start_codon:yes stop_codon:yes gene_type:complete